MSQHSAEHEDRLLAWVHADTPDLPAAAAQALECPECLAFLGAHAEDTAGLGGALARVEAALDEVMVWMAIRDDALAVPSEPVTRTRTRQRRPGVT